MSFLARTALFVPGSRPERFAKALAVGADLVIIDLEDAVEASLKAQARGHLAAFLDSHPQVRVLVRVNATDHPEHAADLALCGRLPGVLGIMLPKAESAVQVGQVAWQGKPVWPLIETAAGWLALAQIAASASVARLSFGGLDLAVDIGLRSGSTAASTVYDHLRLQLILHSKVNGLPPPLDTVYPAFDDDVGLAAVIAHGRDLGMRGGLCIHPRQVAVVHGALAPGAEELAWAARVLEAAQASGKAAFQFEGRMVDAPVLARARGVLGA